MSAACTICATTGGTKNGGRRRGLCVTCYERLRRAGEHIDFPTVIRPRRDLVEDLAALGFSLDLPVRTQVRKLAPRMDMTPAALERAVWRAVAAGAFATDVPASASRASTPGTGVASSPTTEAGTPSTRRTA